jgi:hypothetical protein
VEASLPPAEVPPVDGKLFQTVPDAAADGTIFKDAPSPI